MRAKPNPYGMNTLFLRSCFVFVCVVFCSLLLPAQDEVAFDSEGWKRQNNVVPPSPQAASLGSFGNVPINYFTGSPSISIPLQGIGGKFVSSPLSLSYDPTSVKVATAPSWTGLGWSLQAGGVVTRSVQGMLILKNQPMHSRTSAEFSQHLFPIPSICGGITMVQETQVLSLV